jgi:MoxR-like ATPase
MVNPEESMRAEVFALTLAENIRLVMVGGEHAIELATIGLLCQGHLLIEDVPGVGKTILARSIAASLGCSFSRVQFTPDILPSDISGVHIFNKSTCAFEFREGPIMAQIILIDEINRAGPKAQAALLEAMEEKQITVDKTKYALPEPFIVLATINQIERQSTFPLPKSQLDRFFFRIRLGYLSPEEEMMVLNRQKASHPIEELDQVVSLDDLTAAQEQIKHVYVAPSLQHYVVDLIENTRSHPDVSLGGSPRSSLVLYRASQARAAIRGRDFVVPEDIKSLVPPVLGHRLLLSPRAHLHKQRAEDILTEILEQTPIPARMESMQINPRMTLEARHEIKT